MSFDTPEYQKILLGELATESEKDQLRALFKQMDRQRLIASSAVPIYEDIGDVSTIGFVQDLRLDLESI